jgi:hypothetical protein
MIYVIIMVSIQTLKRILFIIDDREYFNHYELKN